jgi:hypothetical protein
MLFPMDATLCKLPRTSRLMRRCSQEPHPKSPPCRYPTFGQLTSRSGEDQMME